MCTIVLCISLLAVAVLGNGTAYALKHTGIYQQEVETLRQNPYIVLAQSLFREGGSAVFLQKFLFASVNTAIEQGEFTLLTPEHLLRVAAVFEQVQVQSVQVWHSGFSVQFQADSRQQAEELYNRLAALELFAAAALDIGSGAGPEYTVTCTR